MLQSWGHKESDMTERLKDIHSWKKKKKVQLHNLPYPATH